MKLEGAYGGNPVPRDLLLALELQRLLASLQEASCPCFRDKSHEELLDSDAHQPHQQHHRKLHDLPKAQGRSRGSKQAESKLKAS